MKLSLSIHATVPVADNSASASWCWGDVTCLLGTATVIPRPIEAGVFGMARTIALTMNSRSRKASVLPAMIDSTSVSEPTWHFRLIIALGATCGFNAITTAAALPASEAEGLSRRPRLVSAVSSGVGCGSIAITDFGSSPSASQPSSRAPPILPTPTRTIVPERPASEGAPDDDVVMTKSFRRMHGTFSALISMRPRESPFLQD